MGYVGMAQAQQQAKIPRIGFLGSTSFSDNPARREAFRQGLRELGYVEGKTIDIEWRFAEGKADRLPSLAAELVRLKVDVIVTGGSAVTRAAKAATLTIPIVMALGLRHSGKGCEISVTSREKTSGLSIAPPREGWTGCRVLWLNLSNSRSMCLWFDL